MHRHRLHRLRHRHVINCPRRHHHGTKYCHHQPTRRQRPPHLYRRLPPPRPRPHLTNRHLLRSAL